jgi:hypothetical protein
MTTPMKRLPLLLVFSATALLAMPSRAAAQTEVTQDLVNQSNVIFKGRVEKTDSSNLKILPASNQTILVRVDEVISVAKSMINLKGATVTVFLKEPGSLKEGTTAIFFTTGWLYGENVALKEVAHATADLNTESLRKQILVLQARSSDQKLQSRIQQSAIVLQGKVLSARPLEAEGKTRSNSEHDPDWWTADVEVQSLLKGAPSAASRRVTLLFAHSMDVMWFRSPKLKEGEQGIWIATEYKPGGFFPETRAPLLAVLSPLDYQPPAERDRIQRLVKAAQ